MTGTLWVEQPMYVQLAFVLDRVKALAPMHLEWKTKQNRSRGCWIARSKAVLASGEKALGRTDRGDTCRDDHGGIPRRSSPTGSRPAGSRFKRPYTDWSKPADAGIARFNLRAKWLQDLHRIRWRHRNSWRPWTGADLRSAAGAGCRLVHKDAFRDRDGTPVLFRLPEVQFHRRQGRQAIGINEHIGCSPIAAFGNSDGDLEMLQWTTLGTGGARLGLIVHHTDAEREYAYDRQSHFGKLDVALDAAAVNKWTVVDMKKDWKRIFAFD